MMKLHNVSGLCLTLLLAAALPARAADPAADPFQVPSVGEPAALAEFVSALAARAPGPGESADEFARRQAQALREACEKILRATEGDNPPPARRVAQRKLAELDVQALEGASEADGQAIQARVRGYLDAAPLEDADLMVLVQFSGALERKKMTEAARCLYTRYAPIFQGSDSPQRKQLGELMAGALRRFDAEGQEFELRGQTLEDQDFNVASLRGRAALVLFWTLQCDSVQYESLIRLYRDFHRQGFEVIGVCGDTDPNLLEAVVAEYPFPWPTLRQKDGAPHPAVVHYGISEFPTTFLLDRNGKVLAVNPQGRDLRTRLIKLLGPAKPRPLVAASPEQTSIRNDMADRILDTGEQWVEAGTAKNGEQLMSARPAPSAEGRWLPPSRRAVDDETLYERSLDSIFVVGVMSRGSSCPEWHAYVATAFAVTSDGILCTSAHVFDFSNLEVGAAMVFNADGKAFPVEEVLACDPAADTCLFRIAAKGLKPLPLADGARVGSRTRVVSHPGESVYYLSIGHVASYEADEWGQRWMKISSEFGEGSSGAPVLDERGNVVGQVNATYTLYSGGAGEPDTAAAEGEAGAGGEPQMIFHYCTPADRLRRLLHK